MRQVGTYGVLALVVSIVTVLFSYLGTICVALLAGMMIGTLPHSKWQAFRASWIFPAVMIGMLQLWNVEVEFRRQLDLAGLCVAAFWVVYLLTVLVMRFEAKQSVAEEKTGVPAASLAESAVSSPDSQRNGAPGPGSRECVGEPSGGRFDLRALQGQWRCEESGANGRLVRKTLCVEGDHFLLDLIPKGGGTPIVFKGCVRLDETEPSLTLSVGASPSEETLSERSMREKHSV
jgi:hypothetical protein